MKSLSVIFIVALLAISSVSCDDSTGPDDPANNDDLPDPNRTQEVTFTLTKVVAHGDCDGWRCESSSSGDSDFKGRVYVQIDGDPQKKYKIWDVDWDDASGTKPVNKSKTVTVESDQTVKLFSEGLHESDNWTNRDENLDEFDKTFFHPIKNYTDLTFDCINEGGNPNGSGNCWCCLSFYWTITPKYVD